MPFTFKCNTCDEVHHGMPGFGTDAPLAFYGVPKSERAARCVLDRDSCVIDGEWFFVQGCLEIPVHGEDEPFIWGVWASLSEGNFAKWQAAFGEDHRSHIGPFLGWLNAWLKPYPDIDTPLKVRVVLRDHGTRPSFELEPTDYPLAVEQRNGITTERVAEIYSIMMHDAPGST